MNDDDIDDYCKQFTNFMQAPLSKKYNLQSSRKRSRGKDQNEGTSSLEPLKKNDKGKGLLEPIIQNNKGSLDPNYRKPEGLEEDKSPPPSRPIYEKEKELVEVNSK